MPKQVDSWKQLNPEYSHLVFDDNDCSSMINTVASAREQEAWSLLRPGCQKADYCRVIFLKYIGGVYADTDVLLLTPLQQLFRTMHNASSIHGHKWEFIMLAFQPQHPIMQEMASTSTANILKQSALVDQGLSGCQGQGPCVLGLSGPFAFFDVLKRVGRKHECSKLRAEAVGAVQSWPCKHSQDAAMRGVFVLDDAPSKHSPHGMIATLSNNGAVHVIDLRGNSGTINLNLGSMPNPIVLED